jgi:hypothetical protein
MNQLNKLLPGNSSASRPGQSRQPMTAQIPRPGSMQPPSSSMKPRIGENILNRAGDSEVESEDSCGDIDEHIPE